MRFFLTIYDDLYKTCHWDICITLNLFVAITAASESIYDVINMAAIWLYMNYSYFRQNQLKTSHYCFIAFFAKRMYEMHLIIHAIDELSRWVKGCCFIWSYVRSCIRRTYVFLQIPLITLLPRELIWCIPRNFYRCQIIPWDTRNAKIFCLQR